MQPFTFNCTVGGITHRPDIAGEDAFLQRIRSVYAAAAADASSFDDSTESLDSTTGLSRDATATAATDNDAAAMRHSIDVLPSSSIDPLSAPPDFLRPVSGPAVPPGCRTKFKYVPLHHYDGSSFLCVVHSRGIQGGLVA